MATEGFPACAGSIPLPGTPTLQASGGGDQPIEAKVQSLTQVGSATCAGFGGGVSVDRDLSVLATLLPDDLTAQVSIPPAALSSDAPYAVNINGGQPAADCTAAGHQATGTIGCTDQLSWSGTVTFTPLCAHAADPKLPLCVKDQTKKLAADSASTIRSIGNSYSTPCPTGASRTACMIAGRLGRSLIVMQAHAADEVAKDPPDSHYGVVARPSPPRLAKLSLLRRRLPRFVAWAQAYAAAIGYENAFATAINRQSGALLAQQGGNTGAAAALARQTAAAIADAHRAIAVLSRAERLAGPAARQLRRTLHIALPRLGRPDRLMLRALRASWA